MKKILGLTIAALLVMGLVGAGTWAYFSDTETSGTNVLTAGTLNLNVDSTDPFTLNISVPALTPGTTGNAANWTVQNDGTISGNLTVAVSAIVNGEGVNPESETESTGDGELGGLAKMAFWLDYDQDGIWSTGDKYLDASGAGTVVDYSSGTTLPSAAYDVIDDFGTTDWAQSDGIATMAASAEFDLLIEYDFPDGGSGDNTAQGDNCTFTIDFTLMQP
ncbi:TasA family protein [Chloroflexota bacterium]